MAFKASASKTKRGACDNTAGNTCRTASPPPQPHTTVVSRKTLISRIEGTVRNINSGCAGSTRMLPPSNSATKTRPAPACKLARADSKAAPVIPSAPPTMATSPKLPLWLSCARCECLRRSAPKTQAEACTVQSSSLAPKSSNQTCPAASFPCAVKSPGFKVNSDRQNIWSFWPIAGVYIA